MRPPPTDATIPASRADPPRRDVRVIQFLRGIAAFGVLVFHAADRAGGSFGAGAAGVDVFFVISGFIMWMVTCRKPPGPGQFLLRRAERIVPLYWLVTLGVAAVAVVAPGAFPAMRPTLRHVALSLFFVPHHDPAGGLIAPLIVPGWTLNYEAFFYLLFAASLLVPARLRAWSLTAVLILLVAARPLGGTGDALWSTYTDPILLEFAAGLWLGWAWSIDRLPGRTLSIVLMAAGIAGFAATALSGIDVSKARVLLWGLPALLLVTGAVGFERHAKAPRWRALHALGDASYSLYLVHGLAISAALRVVGHLMGGSPASVMAVSIAAGLASGFAAYWIVERPLMRLFGRRPAPDASALAAART